MLEAISLSCSGVSWAIRVSSRLRVRARSEKSEWVSWQTWSSRLSVNSLRENMRFTLASLSPSLRATWA
ncbi:hypothetical protein D3C83_26310 [compost metagenome]